MLWQEAYWSGRDVHRALSCMRRREFVIRPPLAGGRSSLLAAPRRASAWLMRRSASHKRHPLPDVRRLRPGCRITSRRAGGKH